MQNLDVEQGVANSRREPIRLRCVESNNVPLLPDRCVESSPLMGDAPTVQNTHGHWTSPTDSQTIGSITLPDGSVAGSV